ncbi:Ferritin-like protein 2 [hydrothermal vent metagenome]|uniref:Ferritin-like protein 2 n=1 Tax=hydrothermal vent metagenome TaxID=652676 RepID=A0A3B1C3R2_9ZZZZ
MLKKKMEVALNNQLNNEFYSAYLYISMAGYFEHMNLAGFSNWMKVQYKEENSHTMKFFKYINERGGKVTLKGVKAPPSRWKSPLDVFEETLKHEEEVTDNINELLDISMKEKDHATTNFLQWYIEEQVEEEANVSNIIAQLKMIKGSNGSLFLLDKDLAQRVFIDTTTGGTP